MQLLLESYVSGFENIMKNNHGMNEMSGVAGLVSFFELDWFITEVLYCWGYGYQRSDYQRQAAWNSLRNKLCAIIGQSVKGHFYCWGWGNWKVRADNWIGRWNIDLQYIGTGYECPWVGEYFLSQQCGYSTCHHSLWRYHSFSPFSSIGWRMNYPLSQFIGSENK